MRSIARSPRARGARPADALRHGAQPLFRVDTARFVCRAAPARRAFKREIPRFNDELKRKNFPRRAANDH